MKTVHREDPWLPIYKRTRGKMSDKMANLSYFPDYIDLELTNHCNFKCSMCPTGRGVCLRKRGFLSSELFSKLLTECQINNCPIRFVRWGESLLHPYCLKFLRAIKSAGLLTHINTNGSLVDNEFISEILKIKLDSIKFSFQGVTKYEYESIRRGGNYDKLLDTIRELYLRRGYRRFPYITVGTTVSDLKNKEIKNWKEELRQIADKVTVAKTRDIINKTEVTNCPDCPEIFNKLSINWDGSVSACCADYDNYMIVGDLKKQSLKEIWVSKEISEYRDMLVNKRHAELPLCRHCRI